MLLYLALLKYPYIIFLDLLYLNITYSESKKCVSECVRILDTFSYGCPVKAVRKSDRHLCSLLAVQHCTQTHVGKEIRGLWLVVV